MKNAEDITDLVQRYRLALRFIWNSCIWVDPEQRTWESVYAWRKLKVPLFRTLVADVMQLEVQEGIFGRGFHLVPDTDGRPGLSMVQVNRRVPSSPDGGVWEVVRGHFGQDEIDITLVDLFDWSPLGYIDLRYYVGVINSFQKYPDKVGQHALVDVNEVRVVWRKE